MDDQGTSAADTATDTTTSTGSTMDTQSFQVPEDLAGQKWTEKITDTDSLWKTAANLQSLMGKRDVPGENASEQEYQDYYNRLRPETPDAYKLAPVEIEGVGDNKSMIDTLKRAAHEVGLLPRQAEHLANALNGTSKESLEAQAQRGEAALQEFNSALNSVYGNDQAKAQALVEGRERIGKYLPEQLKGHVDSLDGAPLAIMAAVVNNMAKSFGEDSAPGSTQGSDNSSDIDRINSQIDELRETRGFKEGNPDTMDRFAELYKNLHILKGGQ